MKSLDSTDEHELIELAKKGDKKAFDKLVLIYQERLLKAINKLISDPTEALDVLQETFIKAYIAIEKFRGDSAIYTWLYRIAMNTAKDHLQYMQRHIIQNDMEQLLAQKNEITDSIQVQAESINEIFQAFKQLPEHLKVILSLREIGGLSYADIAKKLTLPIGTVRSRISRARLMLKQANFPIKNIGASESHE